MGGRERRLLTIWTELGHGHIILAFYVGIALISGGEASIWNGTLGRGKSCKQEKNRRGI